MNLILNKNQIEIRFLCGSKVLKTRTRINNLKTNGLCFDMDCFNKKVVHNPNRHNILEMKNNF